MKALTNKWLLAAVAVAAVVIVSATPTYAHGFGQERHWNGPSQCDREGGGTCERREVQRQCERPQVNDGDQPSGYTSRTVTYTRTCGDSVRTVTHTTTTITYTRIVIAGD